jgi:vacuolar-type H+-ATPase subunit D/Vma8
MIKWIKNLFVSKRLRAANKRILELETEVSSLKKQIAALENTFIPDIPDDVHYAAEA